MFSSIVFDCEDLGRCGTKCQGVCRTAGVNVVIRLDDYAVLDVSRFCLRVLHAVVFVARRSFLSADDLQLFCCVRGNKRMFMCSDFFVFLDV